MKEKDRIWSLIAKKLAGEASDDELAELEQLLKKYPDATYPMELLTDLWQQQQNVDASEIDKAFARHLRRMAEMEVDQPVTYYSTQQPGTHYSWTNRANKKERLLSFVTANGMLSNYCKIAWRNLSRSRVFSIINITGLAIGMAGALLILLWIQNELSFDQFHKKKVRIYKVYNSVVFNGKIETWGSTPMVMAPVLKQYPEVENITRVNWVAAFILKTSDKQLQPQGYLTDPYKLLSVVDPVTGELLARTPAPGESGADGVYVFENRPDSRRKQGLYAELRHDFSGKVLQFDFPIVGGKAVVELQHLAREIVPQLRVEALFAT